jgi:hypothetical protein
MKFTTHLLWKVTGSFTGVIIFVEKSPRVQGALSAPNRLQSSIKPYMKKPSIQKVLAMKFITQLSAFHRLQSSMKSYLKRLSILKLSGNEVYYTACSLLVN